MNMEASDCSCCSGTGTVEYGNDCMYCDGTGQVFKPYATEEGNECTECEGFGDITDAAGYSTLCENCMGHGHV